MERKEANRKLGEIKTKKREEENKQHCIRKAVRSLYLDQVIKEEETLVAGVERDGLHGNRAIGLEAGDDVIERENDLQVQADRGLREKRFSQKQSLKRLTGEKTIIQQKKNFVQC